MENQRLPSEEDSSFLKVSCVKYKKIVIHKYHQEIAPQWTISPLTAAQKHILHYDIYSNNKTTTELHCLHDCKIESATCRIQHSHWPVDAAISLSKKQTPGQSLFHYRLQSLFSDPQHRYYLFQMICYEARLFLTDVELGLFPEQKRNTLVMGARSRKVTL